MKIGLKGWLFACQDVIKYVGALHELLILHKQHEKVGTFAQNRYGIFVIRKNAISYLPIQHLYPVPFLSLTILFILLLESQLFFFGRHDDTV